MQLIDVKAQLDIAFKDYSFEEASHTYKYIPTNQKLKSVTQFLSSLKQAFNTQFWSVLKAFQYSGYNILKKNQKENYFIIDGGEIINPGFTDVNNYEFSENKSPEEIALEWKIDNHVGTNRGSYLHKLLENLEYKIEEPSPYDFIDEITEKRIKWESDFTNIPWDDEYITVKNSFTIMNNLAKQFLKENQHLEPIAIEQIVGDYKLKLAGTFDRLYYNNHSNQFEVWDFKTDKKIDYSNRYQKLDLFNLDDCEFEKYSLQTSLYKYIIQRNTPIVLGDSNIVHFDYRNNNYSIIKTKDYTNLINTVLHGNSESAYFKP